MGKVTLGRLESAHFTVDTGVRQGCVFTPVLPTSSYLPTSFHNTAAQGCGRRNGVTMAYRLDGNFKIRRVQVVTKLQLVSVLELQVADDCTLVSHTL